MPAQVQPVRRARNEKGHAVVELAMTIPVLLALCLGAADFGRVFHHAIALTGAADAGAAFGSLRTVHSSMFDDMEETAAETAADVSATATLTPEAEQYCDCPDAPATGPNDANCVDCITGSCGSYGNPRVYVRVRVQEQFSTFAQYPGIDRSLRLSPAVHRRVQ